MISAVLLGALVWFGPVGLARAEPQSFLYMGADELAGAADMIRRDDIGGVQIVFTWRQLEPAMGVYDFARIRDALAITKGLNKALFIQIQDRFFSVEARNVPDYLLTAPEYGGGLVSQSDNAGETQPVGAGWVAMQWNPAVRARYQALLAALAKEFDGQVLGVNLPETAIDIVMDPAPDGFTCDSYFEAEMANMAFARSVFKKSHVVQYVNFWPCEWENDHKYMSRMFEFAAAHDIGLGGPDIVPYRKGQMKNSYPFFNEYKGKLGFVGMAVQEPTLTYKNPKTGKPFTKAEFQAFAADYLGADMIFWSLSSPWLTH
ncbi:MAG: hypothetical protein ABIO62_04130 [Paracoccaceae bacterium]